MKILFSFFLSIVCSHAFGQLEKSPKRVTLETGYTHILKTNIPEISNAGFAMALDIMWQVSGFTGKRKVYLSMPIGYTTVPPIKVNTKNLGIAYYGLHITHELSNKGKNIPFVGYSLLFNQLRKQDTEGRMIGHETHFDAGYNFGKKIFLKAEYSIASYPALGNPETDRLSTAGLKIGYVLK
jgi:hypothetical protein